MQKNNQKSPFYNALRKIRPGGNGISGTALPTLLRQVPNDIAEKLREYHEKDIAQALETLTDRQRKKLFRSLPDAMLGEIFAYSDSAVRYFEEISVRRAAHIIENMDADDAVDVLEQLGPAKREQLEALLNEPTRQEIRLIDSFDETQFGSYMTTNFIVIKRSDSVKDAMRTLVAQAAENDNISTLYVVDEQGKYCGAIDLKDMIVARQGTPLSSLIMTSYPFVYATDSVSEHTEQIKDYSEDSVPVLGPDDTVLGVITAQDLVEIIDDTLGEDYARLAGLTAEEDLKEPLYKSIGKRLPWLLVLLVLGLLISTVIGTFESVMQSLTLVVCFQSLVLDMAGNTGTQSLAVTIRVISDETLSFTQRLQLIGKEVRVSFCNGLLLGLIAFCGVGLYIMLVKSAEITTAFSISGCIGLSLWAAMLFAGCIGTVIPITFKKIGIDPAVASGPFITTLNDLIAVVTYYGLCRLLLL